MTYLRLRLRHEDGLGFDDLERNELTAAHVARPVHLLAHSGSKILECTSTAIVKAWQ